MNRRNDECVKPAFRLTCTRYGIAGKQRSHAARFHLVIGPNFPRAIITGAWVHVMTRQARHFPALVTRRFQQAVVLATADTDHSIRPKLLLPEFWITLQLSLHDGKIFIFAKAENVPGIQQVVAGTILDSFSQDEIVPAFLIVKIKNRVALTTNLR